MVESWFGWGVLVYYVGTLYAAGRIHRGIERGTLLLDIVNHSPLDRLRGASPMAFCLLLGLAWPVSIVTGHIPLTRKRK